MEPFTKRTLEITSIFLLQPIRMTESEVSAIMIDECKFVIGHCGFEFILRVRIYHVHGRVQPFTSLFFGYKSELIRIFIQREDSKRKKVKFLISKK